MRLRLVVIAVVAALAVPSLALARTATKGHPRDHHQAVTVVGTWNVQVTPDGQTTFPALLSFHRGGTLSETESDAPGTGLGAWKPIGPDRFALSFKTFIFTATGAPGGSIVVRSVVTLSDDTLSGPFKFDVYDPAGKVIPNAGGGGTATATRFPIPDL
jgi:hypothetical protein